MENHSNAILIPKSDLGTTLELLNRLLADYHVYYINLRGFHWNIKGEMFFTLHEKFEEWYDEAADTIDEIAERILTLGKTPDHQLSKYLKNARLKEYANISGGKETVEATLACNQFLLEELREIMKETEQSNDEGTATLIGDLIARIEKRVWMLKSYLGA